MMELKESLEILKSFLSPVNTDKLDKINLNEDAFLSILKTIIDSFQEKFTEYFESLNVNSEEDIIWKFGKICLHIIMTINESRFEKNEHNCYLSINDERLVAVCCQLITVYCIHYNLEENVGVSIDKLSKYGSKIVKNRETIDAKKRNSRLLECFTKLYELKINRREHADFIHSIFYRKYMHEMICALIQICYSPNSEIERTEYKNIFMKWLNEELFEEADGALIVSNLIMAQGSNRSKSIIWFLNVIGQLLTKSLLRPNSVMNVIRAVLNQINALNDVTLASDWKKCDIVAKILVQCPKDTKIEDYMEFIAPQIISLFFNSDVRYARHFYRVAGSLYSLFAQRYPQLTKTKLTSKLIHPFKLSLTENESNVNSIHSLNLTDFIKKLADLHTIYITSTEPNWQTLNQLPVYLIYLLFDVFVFVHNKKINAKTTIEFCQDILRLYLTMRPNTEENKLEELLAQLLQVGLVDHDKMSNKPIDLIVLDESKFEKYDEESSEESILIDLNKTNSNSSNDKIVTIKMVENRSFALIKLIKLINDKELDFNFMFYLFNQINTYYEDQAIKNNSNYRQNDQTLLNLEKNMTNIENEINLKIIYFTQLSFLFEYIDPKLIIDKHDKIIQFCHNLLKNILAVIVKSNQEMFDLEIDHEDKNKNEYEILHLILSIISIFTTGLVELETNVKKDLQILLPILNELKTTHKNEELSNMAESVYMSIATYCGIKSSDTNKFSKTTNNKKLLIEEIDNNNNVDDYEKAMRDLNDPLLPVRAHGLVELRKLIDKKYEKCIQNKNSLIDIFIKNIKSDDSYIYLAAINGLISLVDYDKNRILDQLLSEYILNSKNDKRLDIETKLKIGEVLTKTVRNFNELVPIYGQRLINAFLIGCKHEDEMLRSSSLSNLGETCKLLNYSIQQNIFEIINCLSSLIDTDRSIQVKRSAIMVLKMIIEGLKKENFLSILDKSILPLYKLLNKTKSITNDDVIKLNCQLTNEYLNELMKESMFPQLKLEKEIKVLRP